MILADFAAYSNTQKQVSSLYLEQKQWTQKAILNVASMGPFSSDRTICEYAKDIWDITPQ
jgi:starch phosphorylase